MNVTTLVQDIYNIVQRRDGWFTDELATIFATGVSKRLQGKFSEEVVPRLRLSKLGPTCPKALWHSIHTPELAEKLQPWADIKYTYGHIIEEMMLMLARAAGHEVVGEQDEVVLDGVAGHRDCVIDGCIVDVKSSTSFGLEAFKDKSIVEDDKFGYLDQLDGYLVASAEDPLVRVKDKGYILAVDKTLGHVVLYEHKIREARIRRRIADYKGIIEREQPPHCQCETRAFGESGNVELGVRASYSPFKHVCFPQLRTFLYANGPVYLTKVVKRPKPHIMEVDRHGKLVFG